MLSFLHHSLLICYVITGMFKPLAAAGAGSNFKHPLHLSSTELNYNLKESTMEVSCRIFTDDFEDILSKKYKVKADLSLEAKHKEMDQLVRKYITAHLQLAANGKALPLNYIGFEKDNEAVVVYLESAKVKNIVKLETTSTVLYDLFDDQTNIFHLTFKGNRHSFKLTYPDKRVNSLL
ncbi:hypothetical protein AY601_2474 [Pedobacter cryoconitis]|uniref:Uncharacterized protein n=2 Tax=Pedobacter cryoconitis TaxID=188932 RepID=A0A127VDH8_9SPHI|nr:hypothetical protein AY601_2474 [Pedobacter cryoconitis]